MSLHLREWGCQVKGSPPTLCGPRVMTQSIVVRVQGGRLQQKKSFKPSQPQVAAGGTLIRGIVPGLDGRRQGGQRIRASSTKRLGCVTRKEQSAEHKAGKTYS